MSGSPLGTVPSAHILDQDDTNCLHFPQLTGGECSPAEAEDKTRDQGHDWEHDPVNPRNWPPATKWTTTSVVSLYALVTPLASAIMAPSLPDLAINFGITDPTVLALTLSIFVLSNAIGPLFAAPLSEVYGRVWVLHLGNLFFLAFNLGCALSPNTVSLIVCRFLSGLAGSAPIACGSGVISDLFLEHERASAMALYSIGPMIGEFYPFTQGPAIGPIMGGFIAESVGVHYVFYVIVAISGVAAILGIPLMRETYAPLIRLHLDKTVLDPERAIVGHPALTAHRMDKWTYLWVNLKRPTILLTRSFICFILSLYMALMYGIYFLLFTTFPDLFSNVYHFSTGIGGLTYIGVGFGFLVSTMFGAKISDKIYIYLAARNGGKGKPEMRVPALIFGSLFVPIYAFIPAPGLTCVSWYGWSAQAKAHFMMPIIGTAIFGFGIMTCFLPIQLYLVDTFTYAASATAAASTFRSFFGFAFPLFGQQMFATLGYGGGNSLLAGFAIIIGIPFPVWIYFAGERIRANSSLAR
ncbi:major facilitator superfamily domain-containing protein [Suillus clintonianus]|uniref:major facilitator superfamily domain-containing protein n=1 Tax=Suillus clintonianus TaxID=1904413 RepID=UPI001B886E3D|nr:major facilitator superfamily domain-containing protein [Suillus clintonianus]KAG2156043.1 major facilitator superfamily domain-containing protein [Suillus clintonianus]